MLSIEGRLEPKPLGQVNELIARKRKMDEEFRLLAGAEEPPKKKI